MKFSCHSCSAKYQIADEKLGRKGVKVRCKKCGAMIVVRPEFDIPEEATEVGIKTPDVDGFDDGPSESLPSAEGLLPRDDDDISDPNDEPSHVHELQIEGASLELAGLQDSLRAELSGGLDLETASEALELEAPEAQTSPLPRLSDPGSLRSDWPEDFGVEEPNFEPAPGLSPSLSADLPAADLPSEGGRPAPGLPASGPAAAPPVVTGTPAGPGVSTGAAVPTEATGGAGAAASAPLPAVPSPEPTTQYPISSSSVPLSGAAEAAALGSTLPDEAAIESELGTAFAAMFSPEGIATDRPSEPLPPDPEPAPIANGAEPEPEDAGWFVAIRDEQVGPLSFEQLEVHWEQREVGPESLCWKQGMPDWMPIRTVAELAELPDWERRLEESVPASSDDLSYEGVPTFNAPEAPSEPSVSEFSWRPSAASVLDSLAAEELADAPSQSPAVGGTTAGSPFAALGASLPPLDQLPGQGTSPPAASAAGPAVAVGPSALGPATPAGTPGAPATGAGAAAPGGPAMATMAPPATLLPASGMAPVLPAEVQPRKSPVALALFAGMVVIAAAIGGGFYYLSATGALGGGPGGDGASGSGGAVSAVAAAQDPPATPVPVETRDAGPPDTGAVSEADAGPSDLGETTGDLGSRDASATAVAEAEPKPKPKPRSRVRRRRRPPPSTPSRTEAPTPRTGDDDLLPPSRTSPSLPRTLDEADAYTVLRKHAGEVRGCVEKQRTSDPSVQGTMQVKMMIAGSGKPVRVSVSPSRFREAVVGRCVVASARAWRFPKFSGPAVPLDFPIVVK